MININSLPFFGKNKIFEEKCSEVLSAESAFEIKEAYNTLASNVIRLSSESGCTKIAITSSKYGEGKSSLAINLAIALSSNLLDKKILLVDADIRSPHVKAFLPILAKQKDISGLSDFLSSNDSKCTFVKSHIDNLDVVCSGSATLNPLGLLNSQRMNELVSIFASEYDYVIFDTAPINVVSDATSLLEHVNGYIISTKANFSTVPMLSSASELLESIGATVLGVVLN